MDIFQEENENKDLPAILVVKSHEEEGLWRPYKTLLPSFGLSPPTLPPTSLYHPKKASENFESTRTLS